MICTGDACTRKYECGRCMLNLNPSYLDKVNTVETFATFGTASFNPDSGYKDEFICGINGNYHLYEPLNTVKK